MDLHLGQKLEEASGTDSGAYSDSEREGFEVMPELLFSAIISTKRILSLNLFVEVNLGHLSQDKREG